MAGIALLFAACSNENNVNVINNDELVPVMSAIYLC